MEALEGPLHNMQTNGAQVSVQGDSTIMACSESVAELKDMLNSCGQTVLPTLQADNLRLMKRKLLFSFKRDNLEASPKS